MIEFASKDMDRIADFFKDSQYDTVMIKSVLEGHFGTAHVDSLDKPTVVRLDTGAFTMFAGDPSSKGVSELIRMKPVYIVTPETREWAEVFRNEFGHNITDLEFTECLADDIDIDKLKDIIESIPEGYILKRINNELVEQLAKDINNEYFFENFNDTEDFIHRGVGYCILHGDKIISAATSTAACNDAIDIEIQTNLEYRNKGLGLIVGAALVKHCIDKGITPMWLAANESSVRLAERLGYKPGDTYTTFEVE